MNGETFKEYLISKEFIEERIDRVVQDALDKKILDKLTEQMYCEDLEE